MNHEETLMFTGGEDGLVMVWKVADREGRVKASAEPPVFFEEVLVTRSDLEEKTAITEELRTRVEELKMENEYQLRLKDMNYNEKLKELTEKFILEMESLKSKNQLLKIDKEKESARFEEQFKLSEEKANQVLYVVKVILSNSLFRKKLIWRQALIRNSCKNMKSTKSC